MDASASPGSILKIYILSRNTLGKYSDRLFNKRIAFDPKYALKTQYLNVETELLAALLLGVLRIEKKKTDNHKSYFINPNQSHCSQLLKTVDILNYELCLVKKLKSEILKILGYSVATCKDICRN